MQALLGSLTESERALVRDTERERMAGLDEDALVALHTRVRRARDKYTGLYRRASAGRVGNVGARGKAYPRGSRDRGKAEVFEDALARVSRRLAAAARAAAQELKQERLASARAARSTSVPAAKRTVKRTVKRTQSPLPQAQRADRRPRTPDRTKRHATTRAATSRTQARRDSR
jgi:hypothetical protein